MKSVIETIYRVCIYYEFDRDDCHECVDKIENFAEILSYKYNIDLETQGYGPCYGPCLTIEGNNRALLTRIATQIENRIKRFMGNKIG